MPNVSLVCIVDVHIIKRERFSLQPMLNFCCLYLIGDAAMVKKLGESSDAAGRNNVAFLSHFLLGDLEKCLEILIATDRLPEAAFFAR